ncbi:MAG TPA: exodeoxyribonuclease VII large subunit [Steroidobacteraceae bacterium]|jgi:exodeoxyribonuclease VII large subunit|nr:exodeoxyribonuclease VII large subunit [Steroidobacteraceae bacterium]
MPPSDLELDFSEPAPPPQPVETRDIYTPSRLNREARTLLERGLPALWLEGEISNLSRPSSGHWYFSLKDEAAQLRCAMFRQRNLMTRFSPRDGSHVLVRGRVSLYEQRGDYQFIADYMEEAGEGALRQRFELLKTKLAAEGLFAIEHKRPLPRLPRRIGVITSPTGAAIRDVLHILRRRFCTIPVLVYPVQVQGGVAAAQIARTIRRASARAECDVLILVRGGGSLEDLWAFNEESVARAIYDCTVPIVTGIGHEVDFTIADFVADVRAPTPSGAAELAAPDGNELLKNVLRLTNRLNVALTRSLKTQQDRAAWLQRRLAQLHPGVELRQRAQRLDDLEQRLIRVVRSDLSDRQRTVLQLATELRQHSPALRVANARRRLGVAHASIERAARQTMDKLARRLAVASRTLDAVSPLATLERGYAIVTDSKGTVITNAQDVRAGQIIEARLTKGSVRARVERSTNPELDLRLPPSDEK